MKGAERICNIVNKAHRIGFEGLTVDYAGYGDKALRIGPIVLVAGGHARGETCHIFLEDNNEVVEVYGIISGGLPGWTEEYGWIKTGKWVSAIDTLLTDLERKINEHEAQQRLLKQEDYQRKQAEERERLARFNALFE